jgi:hypothetical protein
MRNITTKAGFLSKLFKTQIQNNIKCNPNRSRMQHKELLNFLNALLDFLNGASATSPSETRGKRSKEVFSDDRTDRDAEPDEPDQWSLNSCNRTDRENGRYRNSEDDTSTTFNSSSTFSTMTRFSCFTKTTARSSPVFPLTSSMRTYQQHRRALPANRLASSPKLVHELSFPGGCIFPPMSNMVDHQTLVTVFSPVMIPSVKSFLSLQGEETRRRFMGVIRALCEQAASLGST